MPFTTSFMVPSPPRTINVCRFPSDVRRRTVSVAPHSGVVNRTLYAIFIFLSSGSIIFHTFSPLPEDDSGFTRNVYFVVRHRPS